MAQQLLLLLPAPSRIFLKPLPSPFLSSLPRRHLVPVSAVHVAPAVRRGLLRYATKRSGLVEELEIAKDKQPRSRRANGIFWILLLNFGIYVADHLFQIQQIKSLYLYHAFPTWFQFVTSTFCHANWNHLSSNLFFVYIFGKLVEEEEGNFALWMSYILTGAGANLISWLVLPTSSVSLGASGAVFGLFTISVLVKMSWDWRKILEVLILGQFVVDKVMEAARATTITGQSFQVNNIAHVSGSPEEIPVLDNATGAEDGVPQEECHQEEHEVAANDTTLLECPAHHPSTFVQDGHVFYGYCKTCFYPAAGEE